MRVRANNLPLTVQKRTKVHVQENNLASTIYYFEQRIKNLQCLLVRSNQFGLLIYWLNLVPEFACSFRFQKRGLLSYISLQITTLRGIDDMGPNEEEPLLLQGEKKPPLTKYLTLSLTLKLFCVFISCAVTTGIICHLTQGPLSSFPTLQTLLVDAHVFEDKCPLGESGCDAQVRSFSNLW